MSFDDPLSRPVLSYDDAEALLLSRVREDPRPYDMRGAVAGIAVRRLLDTVGRPEDGLEVLHIAGSKGKGSVALFVEAMLRHAGHATGTFTSPHLTCWNERIRINGEPVDDDALCAVLERLRPAIATLDGENDDLAPTFFDVLTAAGLLAFAEAGCRCAILETGLGGTYDATNVVSPRATAITSIELEHTDKLGVTLESIAAHKAGIIKPGIPLVSGDLPAAARAVISERAQALGAPQHRYGEDWRIDSEPDSPSSRRVHYSEDAADPPYAATFRCPHPLEHMAVNAGIALALVRAAGYSVHPDAISGCTLPARGQFLGHEPWLLVDGAHTEDSLRALGEILAGVPARERHFVISTTHGKSTRMLQPLLCGATRVLATCADRSRSMPAADLAAALSAQDADLPVETVDDPREALLRAREDLPRKAVLCVCGSVYIAGRALEVLRPRP